MGRFMWSRFRRTWRQPGAAPDHPPLECRCHLLSESVTEVAFVIPGPDMNPDHNLREPGGRNDTVRIARFLSCHS